MGNRSVHLTYPPKAEADRRDQLLFQGISQNNNSLGLGLKPAPLPYHISMSTRTQEEETEVKRRPEDSFLDPNDSQLEIETLRLNSHDTSLASSFNHSAISNRYIKRYRNEEEKLLDIIHERDATIASAIQQGQALRAKCNRYKEELDSLKAMSEIDLTDLDWKKKYNDLDKRYRDLKEEMDIIIARNKNGRDHVQHQNEVIELLNNELQQEKIEKQRLLSNSLSNLRSVGVKDRRGKLMITQLEVDNKLLQERLNDLTVRNQRGRDYLSKLEAEKREQDQIIATLKSELLKDRAEKENLLAKVNIISSQQNLLNGDSIQTEEPLALYAQVNKPKIIRQGARREQTKAAYKGENTDTKPTGFDVGDTMERRYHTRGDMHAEVIIVEDVPRDDDEKTLKQNHRRSSEIYEEVIFVEDVPRDDDHNVTKNTNIDNNEEKPYMTTYSYHNSGPSRETSSPTVKKDVIIHDTEPIWEHVPNAEEMDVHRDVTTRF